MVEMYRITSKHFDVKHILQMPVPFIMESIKNAVEKQNEQRVWEQWLTIYPHMTKENFVKYEEFYEQSRQEVDHRSTHDLLTEFEEIAALMKG